MLAELERHPHARAVLAPALAAPSRPSHAYLFHGPGGAGKRAAARALAAELLAEGSADPDGRPGAGAVRRAPGPHLGGAQRRPRDPRLRHRRSGDLRRQQDAVRVRRRVFVIERADELGDEAANRMLKTLEEPAPFVHLILLTDRLGEILPTIRSRCQAVRFEAPSEEDAAAEVQALGVSAETARACVRLALQDAERARELAGAEGQALRAAAERLRARARSRARWRRARPWTELLDAVRARGAAAGTAARGPQAAAELELVPRRERKRLETEWTERIRRARRRVQTGALDLALQLVSLWFADLAALGLGRAGPGAQRRPAARAGGRCGRGSGPAALRAAIELVEETRERFLLNVSEDLACEALAYRLEEALAR